MAQSLKLLDISSPLRIFLATYNIIKLLTRRNIAIKKGESLQLDIINQYTRRHKSFVEIIKLYADARHLYAHLNIMQLNLEITNGIFYPYSIDIRRDYF